MKICYQITFYQVGKETLVSAFLQSECAYPVLREGQVVESGQFAGLDAFDTLLEVIYVAQQSAVVVRRGTVYHSQLVITQACEASGPTAAPYRGYLMDKHMSGDM